jgi:hypothetical protein
MRRGSPAKHRKAPVTDDMLALRLPSGTRVRNELVDSEYTVP